MELSKYDLPDWCIRDSHPLRLFHSKRKIMWFHFYWFLFLSFFFFERIVKRKCACGFIIFFVLIKKLGNEKWFLYVMGMEQMCLFGHGIFLCDTGGLSGVHTMFCCPFHKKFRPVGESWRVLGTRKLWLIALKIKQTGGPPSSRYALGLTGLSTLLPLGPGDMGSWPASGVHGIILPSTLPLCSCQNCHLVWVPTVIAVEELMYRKQSRHGLWLSIFIDILMTTLIKKILFLIEQ